MGRSDFSTIVIRELRSIPRGDFCQNMDRMVYEQARLNSFGSKPQVELTPQAAGKFALRTVPKHHPGFESELR